MCLLHRSPLFLLYAMHNENDNKAIKDIAATWRTYDYHTISPLHTHAYTRNWWSKTCTHLVFKEILTTVHTHHIWIVCFIHGDFRDHSCATAQRDGYQRDHYGFFQCLPFNVNRFRDKASAMHANTQWSQTVNQICYQKGNQSPILA